MDGPITLRRLAALMRSCAIQAAPARDFDGGAADQALRSYKWSYIRLTALNLRWQNLWSYWAIAVVLTLLGRTILPFVETFVLQQIAFCASILIGLCWTVLDILHRQWRGIPPKVGLFTAKINLLISVDFGQTTQENTPENIL